MDPAMKNYLSDEITHSDRRPWCLSNPLQTTPIYTNTLDCWFDKAHASGIKRNPVAYYTRNLIMPNTLLNGKEPSFHCYDIWPSELGELMSILLSEHLYILTGYRNIIQYVICFIICCWHISLLLRKDTPTSPVVGRKWPMAVVGKSESDTKEYLDNHFSWSDDREIWIIGLLHMTFWWRMLSQPPSWHCRWQSIRHGEF